jgi:hypothetical protein
MVQCFKLIITKSIAPDSRTQDNKEISTSRVIAASASLQVNRIVVFKSSCLMPCICHIYLAMLLCGLTFSASPIYMIICNLTRAVT